MHCAALVITQVRQLQETVSSLELQLLHRSAFSAADGQAEQQGGDLYEQEWSSSSLATTSSALHDGGMAAAMFMQQLRQLDEVADTWKQVGCV
jgi:hypothetical protein